MGAVEGGDGFPYIWEVHDAQELEEWDESNEFGVFGIASPFVKNNGVVRLLLNMPLVGVEYYYFRKITVEVGEILAMLVILHFK